MFKINYQFIICLVIGFIISSSPSRAQEVQPAIIPLGLPVVVDFTKLANYEKLHPVKKKKRYIEQGEDREKNGNFIPQPVPPNALTFNIKPPSIGLQLQTVSPAPVVSFNGTMDNGTLIPPDIRGTAGLSHVMETDNQEFKIYTKAGVLVSTLSISTFFNGSGGSGYFDPHILYDANNNRYVICIAGDIVSNGHSGLFLAVSQTNNPTGLWFVYGFDATGNTSDFMDYPLLGLNSNWVVITGRNFTTTTVVPKIFVFNRATVYGGSAGTISSFTDPTNGLCIAPAHTYDVAQNTEYLVCNWNGNSGGSGFVRLSSITGTPAAPVYTVGSTIGVASPWNDNGSLSVGASQSGGSAKIESGDSRIGNAVFINGSLWFCHTAYLPAVSPTRSAADWWQVNPVTPVVQQFGRVEDVSTFNFYSSINVNVNNDVLLGFCTSSSTSFASAAYTFRAGTDAANTMQTPLVYKSGLAFYNKTFGSGRNRFGDYTGMSVDPVDNSFWNFSEWANTGNNWGTVIANVGASGPAVLNSITTSAIAPANFCASAAVNVPFTINAAANAGNIFTAQLSNSAGSFASPDSIGSLTSTTAGNIAATIPAGKATGTGYRIRVVSSAPVVTGSINGANLTISAQVAAAGVINTGFTSFCGGLPITFTTGTIANATTYTWSVPPGAVISSGQGTTTCVIAFPSSGVTGAVSVFGSNANCTGASSSIIVTANPVPVTPTVTNVSGCAGTSIALLGSPGGGSFSVSNPYTGSSTTYTYTVMNGFGCLATSLPANITVNAKPTPTVTGNTAFCSGGSTVLNAGAGFISYNWSTGASTQTISVNTAGTFTVTVTNANGCTGSASAVTAVNANPTATISGITAFCAGSSTVLDAGLGFINYVWSTGASTQTITVNTAGTFTVTVSNANGCTGSISVSTTVNPLPTVSFTGLVSTYNVTDASATLTGSPASGTFSGSGISGNVFNPATAGVGGPYTIVYSFTDGNGCSNSSSQQTTVINCTVPAQPGVISQVGGTTKICPGDIKTYSISLVSGATSYTWTPPPGAVVSSGQGTKIVTLNYLSGFTSSDTLRVVANNSCASSLAKTKPITRNTPATPGTISGQASGVCNLSGVPYLVTSVAGISYNWTYSTTGASIATGQGSNAITANYTAGFTTGNLTVTASNACGVSAPKTLAIKSIAATPGTITGSTGVCANQFGVPYSIVPVAGASNYTWNAPSGAKISDGVTTSTTATLTTTSSAVTVNFGATAGNVKVKANNACGSSINKIKAVSFVCRDGIAGEQNGMELTLYPNPATTELTLHFNSSENENYFIRLTDLIGKAVVKKSGTSVIGKNEAILDLTDLSKGIYTLEVNCGGITGYEKVVVE